MNSPPFHQPHTYSKTLRPIRALSASTVSSSTSAQVVTSARNISLLTRSFCSTIPTHNHAASEPTLPPWIELLESTAQAPWLASVPEDHQDRLRRSYTLLLQIVMYLTGPNAQGAVKDEAEAQQFLLVILSSRICNDSNSLFIFCRPSTLPQSRPALELVEHDTLSESSPRQWRTTYPPFLLLRPYVRNTLECLTFPMPWYHCVMDIWRA